MRHKEILVRCIIPVQLEATEVAPAPRSSSRSPLADLAERTLLAVLRKAAHTSWAGPAVAGTSWAGLAAAVEPACTFAGQVVLAAGTPLVGLIQLSHPVHARCAWLARPQPAAFSSS